ncbi:hypothetical protein AWC27_05030 [Mycobacterium szulgai]|uniref:Uncharacterized protein n=1 Tax=Mycobacterium szulgai TaxID=1787 RepID=A0A1X2E985_MYCSZ|nr:hypothetical protein AWC27_05030 [Mycobacterium szulgai]
MLVVLLGEQTQDHISTVLIVVDKQCQCLIGILRRSRSLDQDVVVNPRPCRRYERLSTAEVTQHRLHRHAGALGNLFQVDRQGSLGDNGVDSGLNDGLVGGFGRLFASPHLVSPLLAWWGGVRVFCVHGEVHESIL